MPQLVPEFLCFNPVNGKLKKSAASPSSKLGNSLISKSNSHFKKLVNELYTKREYKLLVLENVKLAFVPKILPRFVQ